MWLINVVAPMSLAISFAMETSSWWLKAMCGRDQLGLYISRSNIYLYFGRFFALVFNALVAFSIENAASATAVSVNLALGLIFAVVLHIGLLRGDASTRLAMRALSRILLLPPPRFPEQAERPRLNKLLLVSTAATSFAFSMGFAVPLFLAVLFPEYRMSLSYVSQLMNAGGTLLLLFYVDQVLYKALDAGVLGDRLPSYSLGRALGFLAASVTCYLFQFAPAVSPA